MKTQQQIDNLHLALAWWQTIPPKKVIPGLSWWTDACGTCGCFGGWLSVSGLFSDQGLHQEKHGKFVPMANGICCDRPLFGNSPDPSESAGWLFSTRGKHPIDLEHPEATDHEIVTLRLWWEIANA